MDLKGQVGSSHILWGQIGGRSMCQGMELWGILFVPGTAPAWEECKVPEGLGGGWVPRGGAFLGSPGLLCLLLNQTSVCLPMRSKVNLLTPGCSREKCSIYWKVSNKESRAANPQKTWTRPWVSGKHFFFFFNFTFSLNIIALQCIGFCCTTTWIGYMCTYIPPLLGLPPTIPHPPL